MKKCIPAYELDKNYPLAILLLKWAHSLYDEGFDTFVECYDKEDMVTLINEIEPCKRQHLTLEAACKLEMAYTAQLWEEMDNTDEWY